MPPCRHRLEPDAVVPPIRGTSFRTRQGVLLDAPPGLAGPAWVSTIWPGARVPGGWARLPWAPEPTQGRGWLLPSLLALGDVIEFAAGTSGAQQRWWGVTDTYEPDAWLTLIGPVPTAPDAIELSHLLLELARPRLNQLGGALPPRAALTRHRCGHRPGPR